ncbi:MAG: glycosyltransferase family 2 protein [Acidimicrobiales bacterium]
MSANLTSRPVVFFLPAFEEEASVGQVVARVPFEVRSHPVVCLVVDDGSTDGTALVAAAAGAKVVSFDRNRGLGAAVRLGLAEALTFDPVAVAFCDADGEYAPEELGVLVAPILDGAADYVVGSRFAGLPRRMPPHRFVGNRVLTAALRLVARRPISDGQSGYRALAPAAAATAEINHEYNYAQVLTLDLLAKGFRYAEVPISYGFRTQGRSFVRLLPYLRRIIPAVWRQRRLGAGRADSVLDHVGAEPVASFGPGGDVERAISGQRSSGGPAHGQRMVGVVGHEEALAAEGE